MTDELKGREKLEQTAQKLKEETEAKKAPVSQTTALTETTMRAIMENSELAKMYNESASVGAENVRGRSPLLKIHVTNKSVGDELFNGEEPNNGWFFYTATQEQFEIANVHICTVSRGFYSLGMNDENDPKSKTPRWNQIVAGFIVKDESSGTFLPFYMYFAGGKLGNLWEFGKTASKFTKMKPMAIPMFALTIKMRPVKGTPNAWGIPFIVDFEIVTDEGGQMPKLVSEPAVFEHLRDSVHKFDETIDKIIQAKEVAAPEKKLAVTQEETIGEPEIPAGKVEEVNPDDIPF